MKPRTGLAILATFFMLAAAGMAQVTTATFYGTVTDASGAILPGVTVTMVHQGTSAKTIKLTDELGEFAFTFLPAGSYTLTIELPGFKTHVSTDFSLGAAQNVRRTFVLEVGGVEERVTVTGEAPLVNTVTAQQRQDYSKLQVNELPLQNRDFTSLLNSSASVTSSGTNIRMSGMGGAGTRVTVDGTEATAFSEGTGTSQYGSFNKGAGLVSLEAVGEVQINKGILPAEYAATLAGNINVATRSGTNEWHGSLFHNYQGSALNAREQTATTKPQRVFNQFGGSIGGPILKNKMFVFGAFEGYRENGKQVQQANVPTPRLRNAMIAAVPAYRLYVDAVFPFPNQPYDPQGVIGRFIGTAPSRLTDNHEIVRWDTIVSPNSTLTVGASRDRPNQYQYELTMNPIRREGKQDRANVSYVMGHATWTSESRVGYNYSSSNRIDGLVSMRDPLNPNERLLGGRLIPAILGLNLSNATGEVYFIGGATWTAEQKFSKIIGKHSLKFGSIYASRGSGRENISNPQITYASERDLLANIPSGARIGIGQTPFSVYLPELGFFIQDDWRISPKLTINLGLRYDAYGNPVLKPKDKKFPVVLNSFAGIVDPYRFIYGPARPVNKPVDPDYNNFGPRVGFAYNPDGRAKNVIRGGAGVMFAPRNNSVFAQGPGQPGLPNIYVFSGAELVAAGAKYPYYNDDGYNLIQAQKIFSLGMIWNPKYVAPYVMSAYLGIQHEVTPSTVFETAFLGNRGVKFPLLRWFNQVDRVTGLRPNQDLPFEGYYWDSSATTLYSSWQNTLRKRFSRNFSFNLDYVWGKGLSYIGGNPAGWTTGDTSRTAIQDFNNWKINRSPVTGDLTHVVAGDWVYQLPALGNVPVLRQVLGEWQISGIVRASTGEAVDVTQLSPGGQTSRPDIIDFKNMYLDNYRTTGLYLNPAAFAAVPVSPVSKNPIRPGTAGFRALRGPGQWNVDLGLGKNFVIHENVRFAFRVDMFNALNHTNLGNPISSIDNREFGKITTTRGARQVQFHGRLSF